MDSVTTDVIFLKKIVILGILEFILQKIKGVQTQTRVESVGLYKTNNKNNYDISYENMLKQWSWKGPENSNFRLLDAWYPVNP